MSARRIAVALAVGAALWCAAPSALAQPAAPTIARARSLVDEGSFEDAARAYDEALRSPGLTQRDLVSIFEGQALLHHAQRNAPAMERALMALASIAPTHRFDERYPPDLAQRSVDIGRSLGGRLRVVGDIGPSPVGTRLSPRVEHDPAGLVTALQVRVFDPASGQWSVAQPPVEAAAGRTLMLFVEAIGPGGVVLAREGSPDAPIRLTGPGIAAPIEGPPLPASDAPAADRGSSDWLWVVLGVGAALLIASIVAVAVYASENPEIRYQPSVPIER